MKALLRIPLIAAFVLFLVPFVVFAQAAVDGTTPPDFADPLKLVAICIDAVANKKWGVLVSALVLGVLGAAKKFTPKTTKVGVWLQSKAGGWTSNFLLSGAGSFLVAQLGGVPISVNLILSTISVALSASGLYELYNDLVNRKDIAKAQAAGTAAAADPGKTLNS